MIIEEMKLAGFGTFLGTRELGKMVKTQIETKITTGNPVIIDFEKIQGITNSFADECFGKLLVDIGAQKFSNTIKFSHLDPDEKSIINFVLYNRSQK